LSSNVINSFLDELSYWSIVNRPVIKSHKLFKGSVVHPVDKSHLDNTEVKNSSSSSAWSEKFSLLIDFNLLFSSFNKLLSNFLRLQFNGSKHFNELSIIKKRTLGVSQSIKKLCFVVGKGLGVGSNILLELSKLFLKGFLLFTNQESKKLLFETTLGYSEIDNCCFGSKLWGEMRIGKSRCHIESELVIIIDIGIRDLDELSSTFNGNLFLKNWIKHWINLVLNGLNEARKTFLKWPFQSFLQVWIVQCGDTVML